MFKKILLFACLFPVVALADGYSAVNSTVNESMSSVTTTIPGGWSEYRTSFSRNEYNAFNQAMDGFVGVSYSPIAVSSSVTADSYTQILSLQ